VLKERRAELEKEKANFARLREKLLSCVCGEKIKLQLMNANVRFCTTIRTLTSKPGSFFAAKFGSADRWKGDLDADGSVFIERDDCAFRHTLNHLRGYPPPKHLSRAEEVALRADKDYYQLESLYLDALEGASLLHGWSASNRWKLSCWLPKGTPWLLYSASRHGWDGAVFNKLCGYAARSLVLCRSAAGDTFGGFAAAFWVSSGRISASGCFLFRIVAGEVVRMSSCVDGYALRGGLDGPCFGDGTDLVVSLSKRTCSATVQWYARPAVVDSSPSALVEVEVYAIE
jgi:hypothetical protein